MEAKYVLRIRDSKPIVLGFRGHSDPMDVDAIKSLESGTGKGKGSSSPRDGCFKCGGNNVQRYSSNRVTPRKGNRKKGKQSKSWSPSVGQGKGKAGEGDGQSKDISQGSKSAKGSYRGESSKTGLSYLENPESRIKLRHTGSFTDVSH